MEPSRFPVNLADLSELTGPPVKSVVCSLPIPAETEELINQTARQIETLHMLARSIPEIDPELHEMLRETGLSLSAPDDRTRMSKVLGLSWEGFTAHLESLRSQLPLSCSNAFIKEYDSLLELTEKCASSLSSSSFTLELTGDMEAIEQLQQDLVNEFTDMLEDTQGDLAAKYGWKRGVTTCCSSTGFNPPQDSKLLPVHDPDAPKNDGIRQILAQLLGRN